MIYFFDSKSFAQICGSVKKTIDGTAVAKQPICANCGEALVQNDGQPSVINQISHTVQRAVSAFLAPCMYCFGFIFH